ncbi:MAG: heme ABC transporter ATP-binding protein [Halioglobus sp.]|nr:heme ABC transporter ATP-binding protein [Halioglobus sp.]
MSSLQLRNVCASPWGEALLKNITFTLEPGTIMGLAGPNGSGKSSLLHLIAGDIESDSGQLIFDDRALHEWSTHERACHMAFLPQMSLLSFPYTVEEVVMLGRTPHSSGYQADRDVVEQALQLTDTATLRHRLYTQLSGGEKQRTQLARIFAQVCGEESLTGRLLLLDEPTSALDLAHQQQVLSAVRQLARRGCAVVLVIHDLNLAASIADQILVLNKGQQAALGRPKQVLTTELFKEVFTVDVTVSSHPTEGYPMITPHRLTC